MKPTASAHTRSRRINPDSIQTLWFTVGLVGFLAIASFMVSFAGLHEVASWVGLPVWLRWTVPVFIDVAILAYSLAVLIHRSRQENTWGSWISLAGFTLVSVIANASHALSMNQAAQWQGFIGAGIAGLAPIAVFAATEELGRLAVATTPHEPDPAEIPLTSGPSEELADFQGSATEPSPTDFPPSGVVDEPGPQLPADDSVEVGDSPLFHELAQTIQTNDTVPLSQDVSDSTSQVLGGMRTVDLVALPDGTRSNPVVRTVWRPGSPQLRVVDQQRDQEQELLEWIRHRTRSGEKVTGTDLATQLGVSDRTGRNRLKTLKTKHPEIFDDHSATAVRESR